MNDVATAGRTRLNIARELGVDSDFDADREIGRRVAYLADALSSTRTAALVLAISGGVDSATAGRLCQLAVEKARGVELDAVFVAMRLPYGVQHDEHDAQAALAFIRPDRTMTVDIRPASDASLRTLLAGGLALPGADQEDFVLGNIKARQRMIAHALDAPTALIGKTPTADLESLRPGRPDEEVFGFTYDEIDNFLEGRAVKEAVAQAILDRYQATAHKRQTPTPPGARP